MIPAASASTALETAPLQPLRVMCISHSAVSRAGGRLRYSPLLGRPDLSVSIVTPARWHEYGRWHQAEAPHPHDVPVHVLPIRLPKAGPMTWHLHHYVGLGRLMRQVRPQVIHLWQEPWSLVTLQALELRNRLFPNARIVLEVDQNILKRLPPPFQGIRKRVLRQTSFVLARSTEAARVVAACGYAGPSALLGYGVDQSVFRPTDRAAARAEFGIDGFTVGYVGRLIEEKGVDDLLMAVAAAKAPIQVAIMGEGPHRAALAARAEASGLSGRVRFLPWREPSQVAAFMTALDALALLTRTTRTIREQFGRVIIEAQACGTPVIGSSCGAIPHVVGTAGWVVPERDPAVLTALLDRLAAHPLELQSVQARTLRQVGTRYTYAAIGDSLAKAWHSASEPP